MNFFEGKTRAGRTAPGKKWRHQLEIITETNLDMKDHAQGGSHVTRHVGTDMERVSMVMAKRAQMTHG